MSIEKIESYIEYFRIAKAHDYVLDFVNADEQTEILHEVGESVKGRLIIGDKEIVSVEMQIERLKRLKEIRKEHVA